MLVSLLVSLQKRIPSKKEQTHILDFLAVGRNPGDSVDFGPSLFVSGGSSLKL